MFPIPLALIILILIEYKVHIYMYIQFFNSILPYLLDLFYSVVIIKTVESKFISLHRTVVYPSL